MVLSWAVLLSCNGTVVHDSTATDTPTTDSATPDSGTVPVDTADSADSGDTAEPRTYTATLDDDGTLHVIVGADTYVLQTEPTGAGTDWSWTRTLTLETDRLLVHDTLASSSSEDRGVALRHTLTPPETATAVYLAGVERAELAGGSTNPTTLMTLPASQLGTVAVDGPSWVQFWARTDGTDVKTGLTGVHLPPGESHTLTLALYPLDGGDYWDFLNRARQDFAPRLTIPHWDFGPSATYWDTPGALEPYLARRDLQVGAALPFLDYDNSWIARGDTIAEQRVAYLEQATEALEKIHAVDPDLVLLTELEGVFTQLTLDQSTELVALLDEVDRWAGYPKTLTTGQQSLLESWGLDLGSMPLNDDGFGSYELYVREGATLIALLTYPELGTTAWDAFVDQVRFSLDEVRAGGVFVDGGGPVNDFLEGPGEDGVSAVLDRETGELLETRRDYRLTLSDGIVPALQEALDEGAFVAANGFGPTPEMTAQPVLRFMETGWLFDPLDVADDGRPQVVEALATGHLNTPVALGNVPGFYNADKQASQFVMRDVIARLAHGLLYGGYNTEIPESGAGQGSWAALNAMFPITPTELHSGWIVGEERTVTAVSGSFAWSGEGTPSAKCFGLDGALSGCTASTVTESGDGWIVDLTLDDWDQVAVIDEREVPVAVLAQWSMDEADAGRVSSLTDSVGRRDLDRVLESPRYSGADPPEGTAFTTGWDGASTGLFDPDPGFEDLDAWTFEAWVRRADADAAGCFFGNGHVQDYEGLARVCVRADGTVEAKLVGGGAGTSGNAYDLVTFAGPDDSDWHHLALTWSEGTAQGYVDHAASGGPTTTTHHDGRIFTDYAYLTVGFANDITDSPGAWWSGDLDAIRLSSEVLSPDRFLAAAAP